MADVITDVKQVTPEWLMTVLRANGHLNHGQVTAVEVKSSRQTIISNIYYLN